MFISEKRLESNLQIQFGCVKDEEVECPKFASIKGHVDGRGEEVGRRGSCGSRADFC